MILNYYLAKLLRLMAVTSQVCSILDCIVTYHQERSRSNARLLMKNKKSNGTVPLVFKTNFHERQNPCLFYFQETSKIVLASLYKKIIGQFRLRRALSLSHEVLTNQEAGPAANVIELMCDSDNAIRRKTGRLSLSNGRCVIFTEST